MRAIMIWCSLAAAGSLAGIIDSFTMGAPHLPDAVWEISLVGIFPAAFVVVAKLLFRHDSESLRGLADGVKSLPLWGAV